MKHIKLIGISFKSSDSVLGRVLKQTHRGSRFGTDGSESFYATNGVRLASCHHHAHDSFTDPTAFFVRGSASELDDVCVVYSKEAWVLLKQAVEDYNNCFGASQDENVKGKLHKDVIQEIVE